MTERGGQCIQPSCIAFASGNVSIANVIVPSRRNRTFIFAGRKDAFRKPLDWPTCDDFMRGFENCVIYRKYLL
jgi:hypothetical protein